jgi:hypothetical protein
MVNANGEDRSDAGQSQAVCSEALILILACGKKKGHIPCRNVPLIFDDLNL